jgi:nitroreductase/NAD-dependent dihydropyrimidine dehydrogenase PreA subunit
LTIKTEDTAMAMTWEKDLKEIFRPEGVHMGTMKVDPDKCTGCGLCVQNCLFRTWEMGEDNVPRYKRGWACFSCYNCLVACPAGAISIDEPYHVDSGFWATLPHKLPAVKPLQPQDAQGNPDKWTDVERTVFTRRSVRNFSNKPVAEPLIRRVIEAGRHAPSGGNSQPWKFIVVTNKALIDQMNEAAYRVIKSVHDMYMDEEKVKQLAAGYAQNPNPGGWDPRIILGGMGTSVVARVNPVLLGAPVVILIAADRRAIGGPQMQVGICGQNMILVANSLGLKATWVGFIGYCNAVPPIMKTLGLEDPFSIVSSIVLGYPKFKQEGVVARDYRPITWFREGREGAEVEEVPPIPEVSD